MWDVRTVKIKEALVGQFSVSVLVGDEVGEIGGFQGFMDLQRGNLERSFGTSYWDLRKSVMTSGVWEGTLMW